MRPRYPANVRSVPLRPFRHMTENMPRSLDNSPPPPSARPGCRLRGHHDRRGHRPHHGPPHDPVEPARTLLGMVLVSLGAATYLAAGWFTALREVGSLQRAVEEHGAERDAWKERAGSILEGLSEATEGQFETWGSRWPKRADRSPARRRGLPQVRPGQPLRALRPLPRRPVHPVGGQPCLNRRRPPAGVTGTTAPLLHPKKRLTGRSTRRIDT